MFTNTLDITNRFLRYIYPHANNKCNTAISRNAYKPSVYLTRIAKQFYLLSNKINKTKTSKQWQDRLLLYLQNDPLSNKVDMKQSQFFITKALRKIASGSNNVMATKPRPNIVGCIYIPKKYFRILWINAFQPRNMELIFNIFLQVAWRA